MFSTFNCLLLLVVAGRFITSAFEVKILSANVNKPINATPCHNILPGLDKQRLGVDITRFDPAPLVNITNNTDFELGFKHALFDFTCDSGILWTDALINNTFYQLPDQLSSIYVESRGYVQAAYSNYHSYDEYITSRKQTTNTDVDFGFAAYHSSKTSTYLREQQEEHNRTLTTTYALQSSVVSQFHPFWTLKLGRAAQYYVDRILPAKFEDNPNAYCQFVDYYGTHYMAKAQFGGLFQAVYLVDSQYKSMHEFSSLKEDASGYFGKIVKWNGGHSSSTERYSEEFVQNVQVSVVYYGGVGVYSNGQFDAWWNSVPIAPALYEAQLVPIHKLLLLSGTANATSKSAGLRQASILYAGKKCEEFLV